MVNLTFASFSKERRFQDLCNAVQFCTLCPRLCQRTKVLSKCNGNLYSKVLFIAEAPGRLGADRTGVPLFGDRSGDNFENLLSNIGWKRNEIFISNAVLCNPRDEKGKNGTPSKEEVSNCSYYLQMTLELIQPEVIVSLGKTALDALTQISPHKCELKECVAQEIPWNNIILFPLYHPAPRALIHRSITKQRGDYMQLAKLVHPVKGIKKKQKSQIKNVQVLSKEPTLFEKITIKIVRTQDRLTFFKLTKLLYLIDLEALNRFGYTLSGQIYLRQQEGPWLPELKKIISALDGYEVINSFMKKTPTIAAGDKLRFNIELDTQTSDLLQEVLDKYGKLSDAEIKTVVYRTAPMKYILQQEKLGRDMRKVPVIYKNMISSEIDPSLFD